MTAPRGADHPFLGHKCLLLLVFLQLSTENLLSDRAYKTLVNSGFR